MTGTNTRSDGNVYSVAKIIIHPRYDACGHKNSDIALIKVDGSIDIGHAITNIDLTRHHYADPPPGSHVLTAGWSKESINDTEARVELGEIAVNVISLGLCANAYKKLGKNGHWIFKSQFCTWNLNQRICEVYTM